MAGHGPLETACPFCGTYVGHDITATDSSKYHWNKERGAFFTEIVGRDIPYRKRTKQCAKCYSFFDTYEMWHKFLAALIDQIARLEHQNTSLLTNNAALIDQTTKLEHQNTSLRSNLLQLEETVKAQQEQLAEIHGV